MNSLEENIQRFEAQRAAMDNILSRTFDIGQICVLDTLIESLENGELMVYTLDRLKAIRSILAREIKKGCGI